MFKLRREFMLKLRLEWTLMLKLTLEVDVKLDVEAEAEHKRAIPPIPLASERSFRFGRRVRG